MSVYENMYFITVRLLPLTLAFNTNRHIMCAELLLATDKR